jgi:hypothetical protein
MGPAEDTVYDVGVTKTSSGRRKKATRSSRRASLQGAIVTVTDRRTGRRLTGRIPEGHYTRGEFRHRVDDLVGELKRKMADQ